MASSVHVTPIGDEREHALTRWCWCGPTADDDPDAGPDDLPLFIHHAADLREVYEKLTGEGLGGKLWLCTTADDAEDEDD